MYFTGPRKEIRQLQRKSVGNAGDCLGTLANEVQWSPAAATLCATDGHWNFMAGQRPALGTDISQCRTMPITRVDSSACITEIPVSDGTAFAVHLGTRPYTAVSLKKDGSMADQSTSHAVFCRILA
ncbi:hypothetical protein B0H11DRAFT_1927030 [Mycena galericulata]|nr:hypothetical protein B0H11DRAFT_1927030 [Mycena galericulata]